MIEIVTPRQRNVISVASLFCRLCACCVAIACCLVMPQPAHAYDYNRAILEGVDFVGKDLRDSSFIRADLKGADLSQANLQAVDMFSAKLDDAILVGTDLRFAVLDTASLKRTNLTNALLEGASVFNARIRDVVVDGADFTDVLLGPKTQQELCQVATGTNPVTGRKTRETLFCDS